MKKIDFFFNKWMLFSFLIFGISTISMAQNPDPATGIISVEDDDAAVLKARVTGYGSTDSTAIKLSNWDFLAGTEFIIENTVSEQGLKIYSNSDLTSNTTDSITIFKPNGDVEMHMGDLEVAENIDVEGFSALGELSPNIKMVKMTGTTAAAEGGVTGITLPASITSVDQILAVDAFVDFGSGQRVGPGYEWLAGNEYYIWLDQSIPEVEILLKSGNSSGILSKTVTVLITYEE